MPGSYRYNPACPCSWCQADGTVPTGTHENQPSSFGYAQPHIPPSRSPWANENPRLEKRTRHMRRFPPVQPKNPNGHWTPDRDRATQARFRREVLALYGDRCTYPGCGAQPVQAHHLEPGNNDPRTGRPLCRAHHRLVDRHAR